MLQFYWNDTRAKVKKKNLQELAVGPKWSNIKPSKTTFHSTKRFQSRPLLFFSLWIELWNIYQAMGSRKNRLLLPPKKSMEHLENRLNNRIDDVLMEPVKKTDVERQVHPSGWKKNRETPWKPTEAGATTVSEGGHRYFARTICRFVDPTNPVNIRKGSLEKKTSWDPVNQRKAESKPSQSYRDDKKIGKNSVKIR